MRKIGVSLVLQAEGTELQSWPVLPYEIEYKGEKRWGATVGAQVGGDALLVDRVDYDDPPFGNPPVVSESGFFDGSQFVVTRTYGTPDYSPVRAALIGAIKVRASDIILRFCPQYKQANLTARAVELALMFPGVKGEDFDEPYRSEYLAGQAIWDAIKAVRAHSNALEAEINALPDAELQSWQQHDWPVLA